MTGHSPSRVREASRHGNQARPRRPRARRLLAAAALLCASLLSACAPTTSTNDTAASSSVRSAPAAGIISGSAGPSSAPLSEAGAGAVTVKREARAQLAFVKHGKTVRALTKETMAQTLKPETFTAFDPYYNKPKTFVAVPLAALLGAGFAESSSALAKHHYVLKAKDGYTVPLDGKRLLEKGGYLAIADTEAPTWQPIGPQQANPGPYYLIWREKNQQQLTSHPRPWQLVSIEIARFEDSFPHTVPTGKAADSAASQGFALFKEQCVRCHAINRQGGRVGPELNVPKSIIEYRPKAQIRAYIRNPLTFRYGNMPANPHLTDADLDHLLAYFEAMSQLKQQPKANSAAH